MKKKYIITAFIGIIAGGIFYISWDNFGGGVLRQVGSVVGMYAGVEPNRYNLLAQQLDDKKRELDRRETILQMKEEQLTEGTKRVSDSNAVVYITSIGLLLLALVLLNFYLDWRRRE